MFFSECFQIIYSRNLLGSKYDSTVVTLNSRTDKRQISAAPNFRRFSDSSCSILENKEFWNKWIAFFDARSRCFLPRSLSPAKAMRYTDKTLSFHDSAIRATQWSYIFIKYQHWLYTHSRFPGFVSIDTWCRKKATFFTKFLFQ